MHLHTFQELIIRINNLSTRNKKSIKTTWSGENAFTNLEVVNLPSLPAGTIMTPSQFAIWLGYDIHEGPGHQVHTDLELYFKYVKLRQNPTFSYILNLLEDIRIENADLAIYPGDRKYLDAVHIFVDSKIPKSLCQNPDIMGLIYKHLFVHHRHLNTNYIQGTLDPITANLISEIDNCKSTQDCITLADEVVKHLKDLKDQNKDKDEDKDNQDSNPPDQNPQDQEGQGQKSQNGQKSQGESEQNSDTNNSDANNGDTSNGDTSNDDEDSESNSNSDTDNENSSSNPFNSNPNSSSQTRDKSNQSPNPSNSNQSDFDENSLNQSAMIWNQITEIKNIINDLKSQTANQTEKDPNPDKNLSNKSIFPPVNPLLDRIYVPSSENLSQYTSTRNSCTSQILALKKMFRIYLQAQTKKSQIRGLEEGKLDTQRLYVAATGSNLIFKDTSSKLLPETAIELMIDMSGSMNAHLARTSAIILAEALTSIPQIKLSISGFTTNKSSERNYHNPNLGRQTGMDILQFKDFNETYHKCRAKLGAITNRGLTPLGDAYGKSLEHIINRPETRKIIFLITDGQPVFKQGSNHSDFLLMKKIHLTAKRLKIQTLGLGIGQCEFLSKYFDQAINISDISDLPKNLLTALKTFI